MMSVTEWLFSFSGRMGRGRFWLGLAIAAIAAGVDANLEGLLKTVLGLAVLWVFWAQIVKRAHDRGRSAVSAIVMLLPHVLSWLWFVSPVAIAGLVSLGPVGFVLGGAIGWLIFVGWALIGALWFVIDLGTLPGERGYNRYGPVPR
jgi:uncharacterized membrane protein YhaH (DUF805 family)